MPSWILGAVKASDMTTFYPLAVYASVQKKLGRPLEFPGDSAAWEKIMPMSSGVLNSYFHEWVVLQEGAGNKRFNVVDDSEFTWLKAWPLVAGWFGMEWRPPVEDEEGVYDSVDMPLRPRGYVSPYSHHMSILSRLITDGRTATVQKGDAAHPSACLLGPNSRKSSRPGLNSSTSMISNPTLSHQEARRACGLRCNSP